MTKLFDMTKGVFETNATLAYIDLCGTKDLYKSDKPINDQAERMAENFLLPFFLKFAEMFPQPDAKSLFNVYIYGDSIMMCRRYRSEGAMATLIEFLLSYQLELLQKSPPLLSRAMIGRYPFFYLNVPPQSCNTTFAPEHLHISLCGGKGLVAMDELLHGLPAGVYVSSDLRDELDQVVKDRLMPVHCRNLSFIKHADGKKIAENLFCHALSENAIDRLLKAGSKIALSQELLKDALEKSEYQDEVMKKLSPWFEAHLDLATEIK